MNVHYKWLMLIGGNTYEVHPVYKDDLSLDYELETGQQFFRAKLSGKITFVAVDAQRIIAAPFYTEFFVTIQKRADNSTTWSNYYRCHFFKTDCIINEDDKSVQVQPSVVDRYEAVLNGMEKEFNLIELAPALQAIQAKKRPMLQIYTAGEDIISCISGGNYFETDKVGDSDPEDCHFAHFDGLQEFNFPNNQVGFTTPFTGTYNKYYDSTFHNLDNVYYLAYSRYHAGSAVYVAVLDIKRISDDSILWHYEIERFGDVPDLPTTITFQPQAEGLSAISCNRSEINVYARYVMDVPGATIDGQYEEFYPIESFDIVSNNRNYRYCRGYTSIGFRQSERYSNTPTQWGVNDHGQYFLPPDDDLEWHPVGQSQWVNASLWINYDAGMRNFEYTVSKEYTIKDNYPLWSVISVLLGKIAPNITHQNTAEYSHFFYDDAISSSVASYLNGTRTFLSQKSNILAGEYQEPAKKAPITLKTVMEMVKKVFGCYWYIDSNNRFVIEHLKWFKNGGSYSVSPTVGYDLTQLINLPNGKRWSFATSEYQYEKNDMPARYQYEWMDETTKIFDGAPINVVSRFVKEDKVEEITIASFTSDIDFMLMSPENCSKDGFALFQAQLTNGKWVLPHFLYVKYPFQYYVQNYMVSMENLQTKFLTYDMPSWSIEIDGTSYTSAGIQRSKKQKITFPIGEDDPDVQKLVKTDMGYGQFDKVSIRLSSRSAKVTLKYNTYDD
jgi:hypothetical protein